MGTGQKKELTYLNKKQIKQHITAWTLILTYIFITDSVPVESFGERIICAVLVYINYMFVFYSLSLLIFPILWEKNRV